MKRDGWVLVIKREDGLMMIMVVIVTAAVDGVMMLVGIMMVIES